MCLTLTVEIISWGNQHCVFRRAFLLPYIQNVLPYFRVERANNSTKVEVVNRKYNFEIESESLKSKVKV
jgi:hypothetical protein